MVKIEWKPDFHAKVIRRGPQVAIDPQTPVVEAPPFYEREAQSECMCECCDKKSTATLATLERR